MWLSTDHLCAVWCLQLVLVVNRFLYSIIEPTKQKGTASLGQMFIEDKMKRLEKAEYIFEVIFKTYLICAIIRNEFFSISVKTTSSF